MSKTKGSTKPTETQPKPAVKEPPTLPIEVGIYDFSLTDSENLQHVVVAAYKGTRLLELALFGLHVTEDELQDEHFEPVEELTALVRQLCWRAFLLTSQQPAAAGGGAR